LADPNLRPALETLPHQPLMCLIEEILEIRPGERARARRRARADDWYFKGHFPATRSRCRTRRAFGPEGGLAAHRARESGHGRSFRIAALGPFKLPVAARPNAILKADAILERRIGSLVRIAGVVRAEGVPLADGSVTLVEVDSEESPGACRMKGANEPKRRS
jgi:hypothetical protein